MKPTTNKLATELERNQYHGISSGGVVMSLTITKP